MRSGKLVVERYAASCPLIDANLGDRAKLFDIVYCVSQLLFKVEPLLWLEEGLKLWNELLDDLSASNMGGYWLFEDQWNLVD